MFPRLYDVLEINGIQAHSLNNNHGQHNLWKEHDDSTFIFSAVREPFYYSMSEFCYFVNYGKNNKRTHSMGRDRDCPFFTNEQFINWVENDMNSNYQSRIISGWGCKYLQEEVDEKILGLNTKRINMLIKAEFIKNNENKLCNMILSEFGINHTFDYYSPDYETVFMPFGDFAKQLQPLIESNPKHVELIKKSNKHDDAVYSIAKPIF